MKLALGLVLLISVQLLNGYNAQLINGFDTSNINNGYENSDMNSLNLSPFGGFFQIALPQIEQFYGLDAQQPDFPQNSFNIDLSSGQPMIFENQGIDSNGNPFFEKELIQSSFGQGLPSAMIPQEMPSESRFNDYFYRPEQLQQNIEFQQGQQNGQDMNQYLSTLSGMLNKDAFGAENFLFGSPQKPEISFQFQRQEEPITWSDSRIQDTQKIREKTSNLINKAFASMLENRNEKILDHARSKKFEFHLEPESAIDFKVGPIGLGPYHFARDTDNAAQEPDEELSRVKQTLMKIKEERDREHDIEEEQAVPLVMNLADMEMTNTESKAIEQKNSEQQIKLEEHFVSKEKAYLQDLQNHNQRIISDDIYLDDAYMYIQLDKKVTSGEADVLLKYISDLAGFPFEWIKDISISGNLVVFRVKDIDLNVLCKIIEDNHGEVKVQTSLHIISCSRGNVDIQKLKGHKSSSENKKFAFITIVVVSATALGVLICLLCLFAIKRRQYLRQKLFENVSPGMMKQKPEDDVEQLIRTDGSGRNFISQMWPFKTKSVNVQQADLSRSASKLSSPLNNTQITDLSNRCDNSIENTPVIIDERADSNRSSASS